MFCGPSATPWSPPPASGRTSPSAPSGSSDSRLQPRSLGSLDVMLSSGSCAPQTVEAKNVSKLSTHLDNCLHLTSSFWHCHPWQSHYRTRRESKALPLQLFTSELLDQLPKLKTVTQQLRLWTTRNLQTQVQTWQKKCQKNRLKEKTVNLDTGFVWFYLQFYKSTLLQYCIASFFWFCLEPGNIARRIALSPLHLCLLISERVHNIHKHLWCSKGGQRMSSRGQYSSCHGAVGKHVVSVFNQHLLACPQPDAERSWSPKASRWNLSLNRRYPRPTVSRSWSEQMPENSLEHLPWWLASSERSYGMCAHCQK